MGCFDTVHFRCPHCNEKIEDQTKSGPCHLNDYEAAEGVPFDVAGGVIGDIVYCPGCGKSWQVQIPGAAPTRTILILVKPPRDDDDEPEDDEPHRSVDLN